MFKIKIKLIMKTTFTTAKPEARGKVQFQHYEFNCSNISAMYTLLWNWHTTFFNDNYAQ